jgi:hypothetical protein
MSIRFYNILSIILFLLLSCSCRKSKVDDSTNKSDDAEKSLNVNLDSLRFKSGLFSTTNEMPYENEVESGVAAILLFRQNKIDSIDLSSAIFAINDSAVFYKEFHTFPEPDFLLHKGSVCGGVTSYYLWSKGNKVQATSFLPLFDDLVSSPSFLDSCILYWGLKRKNDIYSIYAMRYHIDNHIVDSLYLMDDEVATDYSGYFSNPVKLNSGYSFYKGSDNWFVDKKFIIRKKM